MNVQTASYLTLELIQDHTWVTYKDDSLNRPHILYMLNEIVSDPFMKNGKANRWLGWAQAVICMNTKFSVEDMKLINRSA